MTHQTLPPAGWERALLVALLQSGDVEKVRLGDHSWAATGYRFSVIVPSSLLPHLEALGADEEDLEDSDHSGAGDEFGLDSDREASLGATFEIDQEFAWRPPHSVFEDGELDETSSDIEAGEGRLRGAA